MNYELNIFIRFMKKLNFLLMLCLFLPTMAFAHWDEAQYRQIEQSIRVPQFADKSYDITK